MAPLQDGGTAYTPPQGGTSDAAQHGYTLGDFIQSVLIQLGNAPRTVGNYAVMAAWAACEGTPAQQGGYNPLNTTLKPGTYKQGTVATLPGNAGYLGGNPKQNGGNPVKNYDTWNSGIVATVVSIAGHAKLAAALIAGDQQSVIANIGASHWGTNPTCVLNTYNGYLANPAALSAALAQPVNTNGATGINAGGGGSGADVGSAVPGIGVNFPWTPVIGELETLLGDLVNPQWWTRIGIGALGLGLIAAGLWVYLGTTGPGQKAESAVRGSAKLAAVA